MVHFKSNIKTKEVASDGIIKCRRFHDASILSTWRSYVNVKTA